eukprot:gene13226-14584_t
MSVEFLAKEKWQLSVNFVMFEPDEEKEGWETFRKFGYCGDCDLFGAGERGQEEDMADVHDPPPSSSSVSNKVMKNRSEASDDTGHSKGEMIGSDEDDILNTLRKKKPKKKVGRKSRWDDSLFTGAIDIIVNNENYRKKLMFQNTKNQRNGEIYAKIIEELKRLKATSNLQGMSSTSDIYSILVHNNPKNQWMHTLTDYENTPQHKTISVSTKLLASADQVKSLKRGPYKCYNCGSQERQKLEDCPTKGKECKACKKLNHFASVCLSKQRNVRVKAVTQESDNSDTDDSLLKIEELSSVYSKRKQLFAELENTLLAEHTLQHTPRPIALTLHNKVKVKIEELERKNIIRKQTNPTDWISSMVVVAKPGKIRICLDPKYLNQAVKRPKYQMPDLKEMLPQLNNAKIFTTLDAKDGFYQIALDDESSNLTTFWTPFGRCRYLRMPFGISPAPEEFECKLHEKSGDLNGIEILRDDMLVVGYGDTEEEATKNHDENLRNFLNRARKVNLKLNSKKMNLRKTELKYMGHILSKLKQWRKCHKQPISKKHSVYWDLSIIYLNFYQDSRKLHNHYGNYY